MEGCETMGMFVNPGNEAFAVALNSEIYIDKTGLLTYTNKVMNTLQGYICNSRPRRFGKSITANMLTAYYSRGCSSREMFSELEISKAEARRRQEMSRDLELVRERNRVLGFISKYDELTGLLDRKSVV